MNNKKRLALALFVIFTLNIMLIMLFQSLADSAAPYERGAAGSIVTIGKHRFCG